MSDESTADIRSTLQKFPSGYAERNVAKLDEFMQLFVQDESMVIHSADT